MRSLLPLALAGIFLFSISPSKAADTSSDAKSELQALVGKIQVKLREGKKTEKDLMDELKEFDAILAKHSEEKTDDVANVLLMKAVLYTEVFDDNAKGEELLGQVQKDFPGTKPAETAGKITESLKRQAAAKKIQDALAVGTAFPNFEERDLDGNPLSVSALKGHVVLIDFWATWCGPCVRELPNVLSTYEKYHDKGFDIVGISLDKDKDALTKFIKEHKMGWPQFFDGQGWQNTLAQKYGVNSIPSTYLLDKDGKILAKGLRGDALGEAVDKALGGS